MGAAFDCDGLVDDVTLDLSGGRQAHLEAAHATDHTAVYDHVVGDNFAAHGGGFTDGQQVGVYVAFDLTFDLNVASGFQIALHQQV